MVAQQDYAKLFLVYVPCKGSGAVLTPLQLQEKLDGHWTTWRICLIWLFLSWFLQQHTLPAVLQLSLPCQNVDYKELLSWGQHKTTGAGVWSLSESNPELKQPCAAPLGTAARWSRAPMLLAEPSSGPQHRKGVGLLEESRGGHWGDHRDGAPLLGKQLGQLGLLSPEKRRLWVSPGALSCT